MARRIDVHDDSGFTLTELLVAMGLLTVFMTIFTTVTYLMTSTTSKVERITESVRQGNQAFMSLDKSLRYASAISKLAVTGGVWHVEYDLNRVDNGVQSDVCNQLRIANSQLQRRTWTVNSAGTGYVTGTLSGWVPLASNVTNGGVANTAPTGDNPDLRPFVTPDANSVAQAQYQRLTVNLVTAGNSANTTTDTNRVSMTFAAINSTTSSSTTVCQQVAVDASA